MVGRATPMMDVSKIIKNWANDKMVNAFHLFGFDTSIEEGEEGEGDGEVN